MSVICSFLVFCGAISFSTHAALSAVTAQVIRGNAPGISFDGGATMTNTLSGLLSVEYPAGTTITSTTSTITVKPTDTFTGVLAKVKADGTARNLSVLGQYMDDDGDAASGTGVTGTIKATWSYVKGGTTVKLGSADLSSKFDICNAPYKLTIEVNGAGAASVYGLPKTNSLGSASRIYTVNLPASSAAICFAQPNLTYSFAGYNAAVWDPAKGFLLQSKSNPALNFPTTGFDGAWFNLVVSGIDAMAVGGWTVSYPSSVTNVKAKATATSSKTVRIDISGPNETTALRSNNKLDFTPTHIKITDKGGNNVSYEFKINRWFIPKSGNGYTNAKPFCDSLGSAAGRYIVPTRADYTNNPNANPVTYPPYPTTNGTNPREGNYTRAIGQGVFSEWGITHNSYYTASSWKHNSYWASEAWSATAQYNVYSRTGLIHANDPANTSSRVACRAL